MLCDITYIFWLIEEVFIYKYLLVVAFSRRESLIYELSRSSLARFIEESSISVI